MMGREARKSGNHSSSFATISRGPRSSPFFLLSPLTSFLPPTSPLPLLPPPPAPPLLPPLNSCFILLNMALFFSYSLPLPIPLLLILSLTPPPPVFLFLLLFLLFFLHHFSPSLLNPVLPYILFLLHLLSPPPLPLFILLNTSLLLSSIAWSSIWSLLF